MNHSRAHHLQPHGIPAHAARSARSSHVSGMWGLAVMMLWALVGCSADSEVGGACSAVDPSLGTGAAVGTPCTTDDECGYGRCHTDTALASFGFCTRRCDCPSVHCADDDGNDVEHFCQRFDPESGALSICTIACDTLADCPEGYTACELVTGQRTVCTAR